MDARRVTNPYTPGLRIGSGGAETTEEAERRANLEETDRKLHEMADFFGPPGGGFHAGPARNPSTPGMRIVDDRPLDVRAARDAQDEDEYLDALGHGATT